MVAENVKDTLNRYSKNYIFRLLTLFLMLFVLDRFSSSVLISGSKINILPGAGVSIAALLIWGYSVWPAIFLASVASNWVNLNPETIYFGSNVAKTLGPLIAAYFCHRDTGFHFSLDRFDDAMKLILAAIFAGLITALIGIEGFLFSGVQNNRIFYFLEFWASDILGILLTAPLILVFYSPETLERFRSKNIGQKEKVAIGLSVITVILLITKFNGPVRLYFFFPLLFWIAMRLGQRGAALATFLFTCVVVLFSIKGIGPFGENLIGAESTPFLILFLIALQVTGVTVAGALEQREAERIKEVTELGKANLDLKSTLQELKEAKEAAEAGSAAKSVFLANVSHEIRTPLAAVLGFSELVLTDNITQEERKKIYEVIKRNGMQLLNVINDILDLSKIEVGKFEMQKTVISLNEILDDIKTTMAPDAEKKDLELKMVIDPNIPLKIYTDPLRLRQILLNIVGNAIKFTDTGSIEIKVKVIVDSNGLTKLAFTVKDTGIGISSDKIKDLFAPFAQLDTSSTRRFGGTGLGLALSQRLAIALGGRIELNKSILGQGSEFLITIDPGDSEQIARNERKLKAQIALQLENIMRNKNPRSKKVLLVEDNPDNQSLFSYYINSMGSSLETAVNGLEALQKIHNGQYDVVLMDLQMPELDGWEATKILRSEGYKKPIIALSAHAMKEVKERCLANGFDAYISKPVEKNELIRAIAQFFPDEPEVVKKPALAISPAEKQT